MKNKTQKIALIFFSSLFGLFLAETFSWFSLTVLKIFYKRIVINEFHTTLKNDEIDRFPLSTNSGFRLTRPLPYKDSKYFDWFMEETIINQPPECQSKIYADESVFKLSMLNTPNCRSIAIVNGWRVTTNQPVNPLHNIYIFGGSTAHNAEVPNEFTIASYLQRSINKINSRFKVNNRGFTTVTTNQQNEFLYKTDIKKDDIVIYYDGSNNQWQGVANNKPEGTIIQSSRNIRKRSNFRKALSNMQSYKLLKFIKYKMIRRDKPLDPSERNFCEINNHNLVKKSNISFEVYKKNLIDAADFVGKKGGKFFHFYQPNLFSNNSSELTLYERKLQNTTPSMLVPCGTSVYIGTSNKIFSERHSELISSGIFSTNLSKVFSKKSNARLNNEEYFLDWVHITERGNEIIADEIFKKIKNSIN